jgi:hypothetical protein
MPDFNDKDEMLLRQFQRGEGLTVGDSGSGSEEGCLEIEVIVQYDEDDEVWATMLMSKWMQVQETLTRWNGKLRDLEASNKLIQTDRNRWKRAFFCASAVAAFWCVLSWVLVVWIARKY